MTGCPAASKPDDVAETLHRPCRNLGRERQRLAAFLLQLEPIALRAAVALERDDAGLVALGGRQLPLADHVLGQVGRALRAGRRGGGNRQHKHQRGEGPLASSAALDRRFRNGRRRQLAVEPVLEVLDDQAVHRLARQHRGQPTCGSSTTFCIAFSASGIDGSLANTSRPAAMISRFCSAAISAGACRPRCRATC